MKEIWGDRGRSGEGDAQARKVIELAALEASGEHGYRDLTVSRILGRAGFDREDFYRFFTDAQACYAAGYANTVDELVADLLTVAARQQGWIASMRAALFGLGKFLETEPLLARGILLEVHAAGGTAATKRDEVFERLTHAIDSARRETESRHSPPPITARFILNMIDGVVTKYLVAGDPESFAEAISDLLYVSVSFYFGQEEAEQVGRA